jgi:TNF receptor-associated factor 4
MQNTQMESLKQQLQGISIQVEKNKEDKENLEQRMTKLEIKVNELSVENRKLGMQNRELEKELKLKQAAVVQSDQPVSKQPPTTFVTGTYKPQGAEFIMTDFEEYRTDGDQWYSPPFYIHPNGYKMCLNVCPNGSGSGKGTHLSVYVHLMRGEFDDQLKWPYRGEVTVKLVNQEEDKDHVVKTVHFTTSLSDNSCNRVIAGDRASGGPGYSRFLSLIRLRPKYLKNNCIKLCIQRVELL